MKNPIKEFMKENHYKELKGNDFGNIEKLPHCRACNHCHFDKLKMYNGTMFSCDAITGTTYGCFISWWCVCDKFVQNKI